MPRTSSLVPVRAEATAVVPSLKKGNDKEVAAKLISLISDANDGLIRIARLGAFIDHIKSNLPHGHFHAWLTAHCPDVEKSTVFRWRKICAGIVNDAGVTGRELRALERPLYEVLELPFDDLSEVEQDVVSKIRDAAQNTTHRNLLNRPKKERKSLSPVEAVAAENKSSFGIWSGIAGEIELHLQGDSLGQAIAHDPSLAHRIEGVRLQLGEALKVVTSAHKTHTR